MDDRFVGRQLGQYKVTERIGAGGMATVYKGYREDIDRTVAIKLLKINPAVIDDGLISRFQLEARTIARLQHPHIVPLYDYGVEDDLLYLVMAYIDTGTLGDRLRDQEPPTLGEIAKTLREVATALDYAHRQGVVHRDIKPDNIMIDSEGHALLVDFGIAKIAESDERLTATGGIVGTPAYLAPEQGSGEGAGSTSDIYSLGVVIYEAITGQIPYRADTPVQVILKHLNDPVPDLTEVAGEFPTALSPVMQRVLAKNPAERYQTASAFATDFEAAISGRTPTAAAVRTSVQPRVVPPRMQNEQTMEMPPASGVVTQQVGDATGGNRVGLIIAAVAVFMLVAVVAFLVFDRTVDEVILPVTDVPPTVQAAAVDSAVEDAQTFGRLSFTTTDSLGDTVTLRVESLAPPGDGQVYVVWLKNMETDDTIAIGQLDLDPFGSGDLPRYIDEDGRLLPAFYNAVTITEETELGEEPMGGAVYEATLPTAIMGTFTELFISSESGVDGTDSLLTSAIQEAENGQQHAGLAQQSTSAGGMHSHAEHTINILNGTQIDYNGNDRPENPGIGIGVAPLLDEMTGLLDAVATDPAATTRLQSDIEFVRVCVVNSRTRMERIIELEQELLASEDVAAVEPQATEATELAAALIEGVDANGNGQVDPFENECGLRQIETFGLLMATMDVQQADA